MVIPFCCVGDIHRRHEYVIRNCRYFIGYYEARVMLFYCVLMLISAKHAFRRAASEFYARLMLCQLLRMQLERSACTPK